MPLILPDGKQLAVALTADFDAQSLWMEGEHTTPSYMSRGEFGAVVGVPRLLDLFQRYDVKGTFFTPVHTMLTFPSQMEMIMKGGHEIAAHGLVHENVRTLKGNHERKLLEVQVEQHERWIGRRPRGYRSPAWDISNKTLELLKEFDFEWDSSLMGRDFEPYHPRSVTIDYTNGNKFGSPSPILEFPISWYLDDFPFVEFWPSVGLMGLTSASMLFERWKDSFDYAYTHVPMGVYVLTVHPQTIGRAQHMLMLERLIQHIVSHEGAWLAPLSAIYDCWRGAA
jgi:peptidoglycan/xylan/chitin deacetylase (PgdA/CDA1 family)